MGKKRKSAADKTVPFVTTRRMIREAYMAGFNRSNVSENGELMEQMSQPPVGDIKQAAMEYSIARLPHSGAPR